MKWFELLIFILSILGLFFWVLRLRLREQFFLNKKTKEAISPELRKSLEEESAESKRKKEKFENIMKNFGIEE
ncbi:MAG: hypothetical protein HQM15_08300 [Deltaproteobacteria bacterium]|nr:hypothetical protein [Deltaproteobacteria bacterium]